MSSAFAFARNARCAVLTLAGALAWTTAAVSRLHAQQTPPADGGFTASLGQPKAWKWTAGGSLGWASNDPEHRTAASAQLGVFYDIMNPVIGIGGWNIEAYAGARDTRSNGGIRARIASPALRIGVGADYNIRDNDTRLLVSLYSPVRRGGFFRNGTELRFDVLPLKHPQFAVAVETPIWRRIPTGKTRPRRDHVRLSSARAAPLPAPRDAARYGDALHGARDAAALIGQLNVPFLDETSASRQRDERAAVKRIRALASIIPEAATDGGAIGAQVERFHRDVERAFAMALASDTSVRPGPSVMQADEVATKARQILLDEVLLPYDRLLGQVKDDDTTEEFARRARGAFARWLVSQSRMPRGSADAVSWVFSSVLAIVEENRAALRREWGDSRFVWLPLQYGLTASEHDTQAELDELIERSVRVQFSNGNAISYVLNEQFQYELSRTIHETRDYHMLWIHDFRGRDERGDPDQLSYQHVVRSYLAALTNRVREYDAGGPIPTYMIMLDEWFYQVNDARLWMNLLENPTGFELRLPGENVAWEQGVKAAQDSLRAAIAGSRLLQAQRVQHGEAWLRDFISVHVSITNASDPSFWSWRVAKFIPLFDNLMRDHRKLVFYDVTEADPYRGEALYTGAGVGEHYTTQAWEDRALLVRGPALLELKSAARGALLQQGISREKIPLALQPRALARDYGAQVSAGVERMRQPLRALAITNETGFGEKQINVAKGVLYTLMPPGSVIKIPDSLWNSAFWGSALAGCALRGVRVLIIGPSYANAPARAFGSMIRSEELFWRLLTVARELRPQIERAGGLLKVGIFDSEIVVTDVPGKIGAVSNAFSRHAWLRALFGYHPSVYAELSALADSLRIVEQSRPMQAEFESDDRPKLHMKANFFASREAWGLMARPEWAGMVREFADERLAQVAAPSDSLTSFVSFRLPFRDIGGPVVADWLRGLTPPVRDRVVFYTIMGSQNQNARSMVEDGEVGIVVSAWPSVVPYIDFLSLVGQSHWIEDPADLAALFPPQSGMKRRLAHWFRLAF